CKPSGPTGRCSPATPNAPPRSPRGSTTTTLDAATAHSAATHPPAGCHQPDGRVHLVRGSGPMSSRQVDGHIPAPAVGNARKRDDHDDVEPPRLPDRTGPRPPPGPGRAG